MKVRPQAQPHFVDMGNRGRFWNRHHTLMTDHPANNTCAALIL